MFKKTGSAMLAVIFLAAVFAISSAAEETKQNDEKSASRTQPWTSEDVIYAESAGDYRISPDGKWVVWVKSTGDKEKDKRVSNLYLSSLANQEEIPLTHGTDNNSSPRWSPDGQWIAFTSNRARPGAKKDTADTQIWLLNMHGGEPALLTSLANAPQEMQWLGKDALIFSAAEDPSLYEQEAKQRKDTSEVIEDPVHTPPVRLYKISVKEKKVTRLTNNTDWIGGFSASPDGKYAVASHERSLQYPFDNKTGPVTILHNLADGSEKQIFEKGRIVPSEFSWSPDSSGFYLTTPYSTDPQFLTATISLVYHYDAASGQEQQVPLDWENGVHFQLQAIDGGFATKLSDGVRDIPAVYRAEKGADGWTWKRENITGKHARNLQSFRLTDDGKTIVYDTSTPSVMPQLYGAKLENGAITDPMQLTKLNEKLVKGRQFAKAEVIRWKGANGDEVEGLLYYPLNYEAGKKYPLITAIHGGPTGTDMDLWDDNWAYPLELFTQRGAFLLRANYHGSSNYGLKWVESICCGKYYELETPDINDGVDYVIAQGMADANQIATMGWSNGSILSTSLLTTYPERYKVASVGAGDVEWISDWGNVDFGQRFDAYYFGKSPLEDPQLYLRKSPVFKLDKIHAPVLIFQGSADRNVPPAQSWTYFRALQHFGKTVKFIVFPGEPHGPRKLTHQMRKVDEEMAWFDKYFFKTAKPENEAVKKDSPLEDAIYKSKASRAGQAYGVAFAMAETKTALPAKREKRGAKSTPEFLPELVARGPLEVSRFEVTRAQYAQFKKDYKVPPGTENFPATGISLDDAKAYAAWASQATGETWRLPSEEEFKTFGGTPEGQNTLDYWAGYAPNSDDTAKLREAAKDLSGEAPLLREVGSFRGEGRADQAPLYDLGGNAAEWVTTSGGTGKAAGGSADCPADPKAACVAAPEYTGFRVVREAKK